MIRIPGKAADRVATVLRDALRRAVDSQLAYVKKPTVAGRAEAAKAHRWLWVLPTLLLRVPLSGELANETTNFASARKRETIVTDRVELIETDHAVDLLETYVAELETPPPPPSHATGSEHAASLDGCPTEKLWEGFTESCGRWPQTGQSCP